MRSSGLVLFLCAGLLLSGGAILGASATWNLLRMSYYFWTTDLGVELGAGVLFVTGALLCLPACWLSTLVPYHPKSAPLITTLMCLLLSSMVMLAIGLASITSLSRVLREPNALNSSMLHAMSYDNFDPAVRSSFAAMQLELKCCGVTSHNDWYLHRRTLPPSCCGRVWNGKRSPDQCEIATHVIGCLRPALLELRSFVNSLSALALSMILIMAVTLFAAAYTLVTGVIENCEVTSYKPQPLRIACLTSHTPFVPLTQPVAIPNAPITNQPQL